GEAIDLGALGGADDTAGDRGALELVRRGQHSVAIDEENGGERHVSAVLGAEQLDVDLLALFDPFLLTAGCDYCVHSVSNLSGPATCTNGDGGKLLIQRVLELRVSSQQPPAT